MAYDRYDREEHSRHRDERSHRDWRGDDRHMDRHGRGRDDRGFFERASEEISSWFGGSDRDDHRHDERGQHGRGDEREWFGGRESRDYDRSFGPERHPDRGRNDTRGTFSRGGSSERDYNPDWRRDNWDKDERGSHRDRDFHASGGGYRPMTGDYGRGTDHESEQFFAASGVGRGERGFGGYGRGREPERHRESSWRPGPDRERERERHFGSFRNESGRSEGPWSQDQYRRTSFAGSSKNDRDYDPHYRDWRERHMSEIDRDYHDYRYENQSRFEDDFSGWRQTRQQKRGLLGQIREHMEVVGSDDEHVGTVDKVAGDRIILTKSDPAAGGSHHSLNCSQIDRVEGNRVILDLSAKDARNRWRDEDRSRALFERHDQGEDGPGILNRSFSGTYNDR